MTSLKRTLKTLGWIAGGVAVARAIQRQANALDLRDRVVVLTGGSRGLGLVLARELARHGARVAICARDQAELDRAENDLRSRGAQVLALRCDLSLRAEVNHLVEAVQAHWAPVDVLINNAGIIIVGPLESMTEMDFREAMEVNYWAAWNTTMAVLPEMRRRGFGRILNISSIGGQISVPHLLPYCASKFALTGFSEGLRAELAKDGIRVTTVCPGLMRTGSPPNAIFKGKHREEYAWFSLGDALPGLTISAEGAARRIISACRHGDGVVTLTWSAKLAARVHGLMPGLVADGLGIVNRLLPGSGGNMQRAKGYESESSIFPSWLTTLSDQANVRNNEIPS